MGKIKYKKLKFISIKKHYQIFSKKWNMYTEPGRPAREDIKNYNQLTKTALGKKRNAKVVILGTTPEIRDLLYKYYLLNRIKVICLDVAPEMYQAMTELVILKIPSEKFIHRNWVEMDFPKNSIDLFIGDFVIGNLISYQEKQVFFEKINYSLKNDGYFITRHLWITPKAEIKDLKQRLFSYVPKIIHEELTLKQVTNFFWNDLIIGSWFRNKENIASTLYFDQDFKKLTKYFDKKILSDKKKIAKEIFNYTLKLVNKKRWRFFAKLKEIQQIEDFFIIKKVLFSKYCRLSLNAPIFLLRPKK